MTGFDGRCKVRDREADAIATLVGLHLDGPDEWTPHEWDTAESAARVVAEWLRRAGRADAGDGRRALRLRKWEAVRAEVLGRCGNRCQRCREFGTLEVHHKRGRVGPDLFDVDNLVCLCAGCHRWVTENPAAAKAEGWSANRLDGDR